MMRTFITRKALPVAVLGLLAMGTASAQSIVASETEAFINQQNHGSTVVFTNSDPATVGAFDFELAYDATNLTLATADITTDFAGASCTVNTPGTILCFANPTSGLLLPATFTINLPFDVGTTEGVEALTFGTTAVFDQGGSSIVLDPTDGSVTVSSAPPDVVLGFSPASAVAFPGGVSGTTSNASITVSAASGTVGTGTVDNCVITGPNASAFSVVAPGAVTAPPTDTLDLQATLANSALSATMTCDLDDASAATSVVFQLSAPAGTPVPAPEYSSTPAGGSALTCNGAPGATTSTSITITNTGDLPLTFNCAASGAGFGPVTGGVGNLAAGASQVVSVECQVPAEDAPAIEGDLDCTSNDPAAAANNYPLSSVAQTGPGPIPQPNVVPASSLWSQISLIGLMAALGLLVVGIRRKG